MAITRRRLIGTALGVAALGGTAQRSWAVTEVAVAGGRLLSLSDGALVLPEAFVIGGLPEAEARGLLEAAGVAGPEVEVPCNVALWQRGDATVLFDCGAGPDFMPSAGRLLDALAAAGIEPGSVTDLAFTHGHPDHLWGVLDEFDEPLFPNARHLMGAAEHAYWTNPTTADSIGADRQVFAAGAARRLEVLGDLVETFGAGDALRPEVVALATHGHTPGHMSFRLGEGPGSMVVVGDAIANAHVALARPDWPLPSDQDPVGAAATRAALLGQLADEEALMIAFHFPGGGIGRIEQVGEGYAFVPAP